MQGIKSEDRLACGMERSIRVACDGPMLHACPCHSDDVLKARFAATLEAHDAHVGASRGTDCEWVDLGRRFRGSVRVRRKGLTPRTRQLEDRNCLAR